MMRRSTTPISLMSTRGGPKFDTQRDFDYEFEAATSHIPKTYEFEAQEFRLESASSLGFKRFEFNSGLSPLFNPYGFADFGVINPEAEDELVQLEAEVGSLGC
ncbi:unnamed protein product [Calypogeia fissa]